MLSLGAVVGSNPVRIPSAEKDTMKRSVAVAALLILAAAIPAAAQTPIKKGQPAFTVALSKTEVYSVDEYKANIARIEKALMAQATPNLSAADREKAKLEAMAAVKPKLLDALISSMLFKQYCEREGITVPEADINNYITRLKAQVGAQSQSDEALELALTASQGLVIDLRGFVRQRLLLRKYIQAKKAEELKAIKAPSSEEILKAYEQMKPNLLVPETARLSLVFIDFKGKSEDERKKATEVMKGLSLKIKEDKAYFDKLLLESFDPKAGYMARSSYVVANVKTAQSPHDPKFIDAVFKLKVGEISGVLENIDGLQIVRLNELSPTKQLALYDPVPGEANMSVQDLLVQQLVAMAQESFAAKVQTDTLEKLRGEATVTIMKDNLRGLVGDAELDGIAARFAKTKKK